METAKPTHRAHRHSVGAEPRTDAHPDTGESLHFSEASGRCHYVSSKSPSMRDVERRALRVAPSEETVLILGETGVGKDLLARLIHHHSPQQCRPFVHLNCASLPESLLESELFGHVRGAYTGALENRPGQFEMADSGTIFLDEIGEIPPRLQAKLLHVLQEKKIYRLGGRQSVKVNARVLAATNRDLAREIQSGSFRRDLYYRLSVVSLRIPPLRERSEDLEDLIRHFFTRYSTLYNRPDLTAPDPDILAALKPLPWLGNIRELENAIKRIILLGGSGSFLTEIADMLPTRSERDPSPLEQQGIPERASPRSLKEVARRAVRHAERKAILQTLERTAWNRRKAARELRVSYRSLLYKIKEYTLEPASEDRIGGLPEF